MKAVIITSSGTSDSSAGAVRLHVIGKLLYSLGYTVTIVGQCQKKEITETRRYNLDDNIKYVLFEYPRTIIDKLRYLIITHVKNINTEVDGNEKPNLIIFTELPTPAFHWLLKYTEKHHIPIIFDCTEWHTIHQYIGRDYIDLKGLVLYVSHLYLHRSIVAKKIPVISISRYLNQHFAGNNVPTFRLPVILDCADFPPHLSSRSEKLRIVYAGSPGRKDILNTILIAVQSLNKKEQEAIRFTILGVTCQKLSEITRFTEEQLTSIDCLNIMGFVPRDIVLTYLYDADFTILIRPANSRYAKAGFPTKVVESLMSATPIILNMTSDLNEYLKNGYNCIESADDTPSAIASALRRALALTASEKETMKKNARSTAENKFHYLTYQNEFRNYLSKLEDKS